jgi:opacity protein-like surface antigen
MFNYRAEKDKLTLGFDAIYMGLSGSALGLGNIEYDQWMVEGTAGWKVNDVVELFGGVRYNDVAGEITTGIAEMPRLSRSEGWYDPIVGTRLWIPVKGGFSVLARGDIGGFGVGSELTWQVGAYLRYATSDHISLLLGYRWLDIDYETGEGMNRFVYDMAIRGPAFGLTWQF